APAGQVLDAGEEHAVEVAGVGPGDGPVPQTLSVQGVRASSAVDRGQPGLEPGSPELTECVGTGPTDQGLHALEEERPIGITAARAGGLIFLGCAAEVPPIGDVAPDQRVRARPAVDCLDAEEGDAVEIASVGPGEGPGVGAGRALNGICEAKAAGDRAG